MAFIHFINLFVHSSACAACLDAGAKTWTHGKELEIWARFLARMCWKIGQQHSTRNPISSTHISSQPWVRMGCGTPTPFSHRGCAGLRTRCCYPMGWLSWASETPSTSALAWLILGLLRHPACGSVGLPGTYPMPACEITTLLRTPGRDLSLCPPRYQTDPSDSRSLTVTVA